MTASNESRPGAFKGLVYGDLVGAPFMIENTYNRYFPLGESRRAFSRGRVRSFFPEVTEVSHGASAVCNWLSTYRDAPTAESLQKCLRNQFLSHPRGGWTEPTRLFLSSGNGLPSDTPDWAALTRSIPVASYVRDDLLRALDLAEACVRATCSNEDTVMVAKALTHGVFMARHGAISAEIFTTLEMQYGLHLTRSDEDLRAELRGEVRRPLEMMGTVVEGAYRYVPAASPAPPSARIVAEAAVKAVTQSDSWEDAVRRAVAYGGPSNAVAGIAGGLAEALYGEVTPSIIGKLFPYIPTDLVRQIEAADQAPSFRVSSKASPYGGLTNDAFTIIRTGPGEGVAVVREDRNDIRRVLQRDHPDTRIISPSEVDAFLSRYKEPRSGTFAYGVRPELCTYYLQDGKRIVSPSRYVAPGMPPLQERKRQLKAFNELRSFCLEVQKELNLSAGNPGAGQVHYGDAFHLWIGTRKIDFFFGDSLAGRLSLNERGLLKVDLGDYRDLSADARFENHREQSWASRSLFTIAESSSPVTHLEQIRSDIRLRLLDEGLGSGTEDELDSRYLGQDELLDRSPVSNIDHLSPLDPGDDKGAPPLEDPSSPFDEGAPESRQEVRTIYSIGYGMRSQEGFINTLGMAGVDTVVDVRSIPKSRLAPQFDADTIYERLSGEGIDYFLAGDRLGGKPEDLSLYDAAGRVDWEALRESDSFKEGVAAIEKLSGEGHIVAIVSSEGDPLYGHRFGAVARSLAEDGMDLRHILSNGETVSHVEMETRMVGKYEKEGILASAVSKSYAKQLSEAYSILNRERGYRMKRSRERGFRTTRVKF